MSFNVTTTSSIDNFYNIWTVSYQTVESMDREESYSIYSTSSCNALYRCPMYDFVCYDEAAEECAGEIGRWYTEI